MCFPEKAILFYIEKVAQQCHVNHQVTSRRMGHYKDLMSNNTPHTANTDDKSSFSPILEKLAYI